LAKSDRRKDGAGEYNEEFDDSECGFHIRGRAGQFVLSLIGFRGQAAGMHHLSHLPFTN
jgi:hypothetical protein